MKKNFVQRYGYRLGEEMKLYTAVLGHYTVPIYGHPTHERVSSGC